MSDEKKTLYERLGGYEAITAVANNLLPRLQADPQLGRFWAHRGEDGCSSYWEAFFLRSAQRFFIANDKRLRPSGVRPLPRLSPVAAGVSGRGVAATVFLTICDGFLPSSSAIA